MERQSVYALIDAERDYQKAKWGCRLHGVPAWLLVLRQELNEAMEAWATTGVVNGRRGVGVELKPSYYRQAVKNLAEAVKAQRNGVAEEEVVSLFDEE